MSEILKTQNKDGSWDIDQSICCQMKIPIHAISKKGRKLNNGLPIIDTDLKVWFTVLVVKWMQKQSHFVPDSEPDWLLRARAFLQKNNLEAKWSKAAETMIEDYSTKRNQVASQVCKKCGSIFLESESICPMCSKGGNKVIHDASDEEMKIFTKKAKVPIKLDDYLRPKDSIGVLWSEIQDVEFKPGGLGSDGVYFVKTKIGKLVIKVGGVGVSSVLASSLLAQKLNIKTPIIRIISRSSPEGTHLLLAMSQAKWKPKEEVNKIVGLKRVSYLAVFEYIDNAITFATAFGEKKIHQSNIQHIFESICIMSVFDVLINNFDRWPLCWINPGNSENIVLSPIDKKKNDQKSDWLIWAIDYEFTDITNDEGLKAYKKIIKESLTECFTMNIDGPSLKRIYNHILEKACYDVSKEDKKTICLGYQKAVKELTKILRNDRKIISVICRKVENQFPENLVSSTFSAFIDSILDIFEDILRIHTI